MSNILAPAMKASFREWALKHPTYKGCFLDESKWNRECQELVDIALTELPSYNPADFELWLYHEQNRKSLRKYYRTNITLVRQMVYNFLGAYVTNKLGDVRKRKGHVKVNKERKRAAAT